MQCDPAAMRNAGRAASALSHDTARRHGLSAVLNPAPARLLPDALLSLCDLVTPNWGEAQTITGLPGAPVEDVAQALLRSGCGAGVITLGSRGVYAQKAGQPGFYRPAFSGCRRGYHWRRR